MTGPTQTPTQTPVSAHADAAYDSQPSAFGADHSDARVGQVAAYPHGTWARRITFLAAARYNRCRHDQVMVSGAPALRRRVS